MSVPLCLSISRAVPSFVSPFGPVALKVPDHFPVTSTSATAATARTASTKKHRNVRIVSPLGKIRRRAAEKVPGRAFFFVNFARTAEPRVTGVLNHFGGHDERAAYPAGKPWDRKPNSGKLRRELCVRPAC